MKRIQCSKDRNTEWFLGFDGGGTKTHCVLMDARGRVRAESLAGASNPRRTPFRRACRELQAAALRCLVRDGISSSQIVGVCAGLAGAGKSAMRARIAAFLRSMVPAARVEVTTDLAVAFEAAFPQRKGILIVAGTGSAALGRSSRGREVRAGGEGPLRGDAGSAFDVGRRALALARQKAPPRAAESLLRKIFRFLTCASWQDLEARVRNNADAVYPKIFPLVAREAAKGNTAARMLLTDAAAVLAQLVAEVASQLRLRGRRISVACAGGMFGRSGFFDASVRAAILKRIPDARLRKLRISPAEAAARRARRDWISARRLAYK